MISLTRRAALFGAVDRFIQPPAAKGRQWVSVKLKWSERASRASEIKGAKASYMEERELRQLAQLDRQPFELVVVDLGHTELREITIR
jgi:hypothetical protein